MIPLWQQYQLPLEAAALPWRKEQELFSVEQRQIIDVALAIKSNAQIGQLEKWSLITVAGKADLLPKHWSAEAEHGHKWKGKLWSNRSNHCCTHCPMQMGQLENWS